MTKLTCLIEISLEKDSSMAVEKFVFFEREKERKRKRREKREREREREREKEMGQLFGAEFVGLCF